MTTPPPLDTKPRLWNPNAAANWSLLFSAAFGSYLQAKNAEAMGFPEEVRAQMRWFYGTLAYLFLGLLSFFIPGIPAFAVSLTGLVLLFCWYFRLGKKQVRYVKKTFQDGYPRKSWVAPLWIGFSCYLSFRVIALIALGIFYLMDHPEAFKAPQKKFGDLKDPRVSVAESAIRAGDFASAKAALDALKKDYPDHPLIDGGFGYYEFAQGHLPEARTYIGKALLANPGYVWGYTLLGRIEMADKNYDEAEKAFRQSLKIQPDFAMAWTGLSCVYMEDGRLRDADTVIDQILKCNPMDTDALWNRVIVSIRRGDRKIALDRVDESLRVFPEASRLHGLRADLLHKQKDYLGELEEVELAMKTQKSEPVNMARKSRALAALGRVEEAQELVNAAMLVAPQDLGVREYAGEVFSLLGQHNAARENHEFCVQDKPQSGFYLNLLATTLASAGNVEEAVKNVEEAVKLDPYSLEYWTHLKTLSEKTGDINRKDECEEQIENLRRRYGTAGDPLNLGS